MKKLIRLFVFIVFLVAAYFIISLFNEKDNIIRGLIGCFAVTAVHYVCWDFLEFNILDNFLGRLVKRVLFYGVFFYFVYDSLLVSRAEVAMNHDIFNDNAFYSKYLCGSILGIIATGFLCYGSYYSNYPRYSVIFIPIIAFLFTLLGGFIIVIFIAVGKWLANLLIWIILIGGGLLFLKVNLSGKLIYKYYEGCVDDDIPSSSSSSSYRVPRSSGNPISDLSYFMSSIASKNTRTRGCSYGATARSSISQSLYDDTASFTVDILIDATCCSATNQNEMSWVNGDIQRFQKEIMQDIYNEMSSYIKRLMSKHSDFKGVDLEVLPGDIREY